MPKMNFFLSVSNTKHQLIESKRFFSFQFALNTTIPAENTINHTWLDYDYYVILLLFILFIW